MNWHGTVTDVQMYLFMKVKTDINLVEFTHKNCKAILTFN